jgi:hypothetical protein
MIKHNLMDKRAIGFGRMLAAMTFILFGLMIWFFVIANQRIEASLGTEELRDIDSKNLEFYFADSMNLGLDNAVGEFASSSFVDKEIIDCKLTSENVFILNNNCQPNPDFIRIVMEEKVASYIQESMASYPLDNQKIEVSCNIEKENNLEILKCQSNDLILNSSRKNKFFSYSLNYKFNLNNSIIMEDKMSFNEIKSIFQKFSECKENCQLESEFWTLDKTEEKGDYFIYSLINKKLVVLENVKPVKWVFAIEKK